MTELTEKRIAIIVTIAPNDSTLFVEAPDLAEGQRYLTAGWSERKQRPIVSACGGKLRDHNISTVDIPSITNATIRKGTTPSFNPSSKFLAGGHCIDESVVDIGEVLDSLLDHAVKITFVPALVRSPDRFHVFSAHRTDPA